MGVFLILTGLGRTVLPACPPGFLPGAMLDHMRLSVPFRCAAALLMLCAALPLSADTRFQVRRMTRNDIPAGKGQCDIQLLVDNEVEVSVRGDMVDIRTISGHDARDRGSECNAPLPDRDVAGFRFENIESRGEVRLIGDPSRRNGFAAIVHIRDGQGGEGGYHFRISWAMTGRDSDRPPSRRSDDVERPRAAEGGFSWNNALSFRGVGRGRATTNDSGEMRLGEVTVDRSEEHTSELQSLRR